MQTGSWKDAGNFYTQWLLFFFFSLCKCTKQVRLLSPTLKLQIPFKRFYWKQICHFRHPNNMILYVKLLKANKECREITFYDFHHALAAPTWHIIILQYGYGPYLKRTCHVKLKEIYYHSMAKQTKRTFLKKCKMDYYTDKQLYHSQRGKKWDQNPRCFLW